MKEEEGKRGERKEGKREEMDKLMTSLILGQTRTTGPLAIKIAYFETKLCSNPYLTFEPFVMKGFS